MDLMSDESIGALGLLVAEAAERLVDSHDESLDKRAAMLLVESPTFSSEHGRMQFGFKVKGNRQSPIDVTIEVAPEELDEEEEYDTLGGFVFGRLNRIPVVGDQIELEGGSLRVVMMRGRRVDYLLYQPRA